MSTVRIKKPIIRGIGRVKQILNRAIAGVQLIFAKRRVERFVIRKIQDRFEPLGTNPFAQRAPSGRIWKAPRDSTILSRSNPNRRQALFNKGTLRDSIGPIKGNLGIARGTAVRTSTATVGIKPGARNSNGDDLNLIGAFLQAGGTTPTGGVVPGRPFIGISRKDEEELENTIQRIMGRAVG